MSSEEDNEESDKDSDDKLVMYYNGGEEIELYEYGSIPMKYYGPDFGYTEKSDDDKNIVKIGDCVYTK